MDLNKLPYYPNILLVTGNGRNVGKTTFSCAVIEHLKEEKIIGVKISPHFHEFDPEEEDVLYQKDDIIIIEEHRKNTGKDSAKLLAAGAYRVFFIMAKDRYLNKAFRILIELAGTDYPMIIESAALRNTIIPSNFLLLSRPNRPQIKDSIAHLMEYVDYKIILDDEKTNLILENLSYSNSEWKINLTAPF
jgi:hypothetical protein